ncbi:uncharacterized protein LOC142979585 [Anticarsia gemmatalis]|uniref:uncharacterized protein LOC142979585 n=1 Tax=Anticarsia gemmatalis TaxID=129554 RepID=UPI003F76921E
MAEIGSNVGESDADLKAKPVKEILVVQDEGFFKFETGDTYEGSFEAKKKDRYVKMHGQGVYTTAEGDIYTGVWDADRLGGNDEVTITFTDGSIYHGHFKEWCYSGHGQYLYPDGSLLRGEFSENSPVGHHRLIDPNGHIWLGKAEQGYGWFEPVNHFFDMLESMREPSKIRRLPKVLPTVSSIPASVASKKLRKK